MDFSGDGLKHRGGQLRPLAEGLILERRVGSTIDAEIGQWDAKKLLHESEVHRIEPGMQKEEFLRTQESPAFYRDLYEFAPVGYLVLDRDGTVRHMNLTGAILLSADRSRLVGKHLRVALHVDDRPNFDQFLAKVLWGGIKETCEVSFAQEGGEVIVLELTGTAVNNGSECRIAVTDITGRKRADRERELLQLQSMQSSKMESVGTLASVIAHDLNNILGGILGALSLMDLALEKDESRRLRIMEMQTLVERGAGLTKQLMGFTPSVNNGFHSLNIAHAIEKMSAMFALKHSLLSIEHHIAEDLRRVRMDPLQFEQMMMDFLVNAGRAMPKGGRLIITAENKELSPEDVAPHGTAPGQYIKLVVSDTGIGMDAETKMHLFEPSFRTDGENRGMMHGLFSVFNIVKNHLGFITFESEPGSGAVFRIYLPSFDPPRKNEALNNQPIKAGKGTILIVDDEKLILNCYSTLLAKIGYDVLTASNGKEAVEMMRRYKGKISVVVLDLIMPEMNGKEAYLEMREIMPSVKVLLSSGYNSDGQVEELLALGCNGFLQKPCNLAELSRKIQDIL